MRALFSGLRSRFLKKKKGILMQKDEIERLAEVYAFHCPEPFGFPDTTMYDQVRCDGVPTLSVIRCPGVAQQILWNMSDQLSVSDEFATDFGLASAVFVSSPKTSICCFKSHLLASWLGDSEIRASLPESHSMWPEDLVALLEKYLNVPGFFSTHGPGTLFYVENRNGETKPVTLCLICGKGNEPCLWRLDVGRGSQDERRTIGMQLTYRVQ